MYYLQNFPASEVRNKEWVKQHFLDTYCLLTAVTIKAKAGATELDFQQLCPWDRRGVRRTLTSFPAHTDIYHIPEFTMAENPRRLREVMWGEIASMSVTVGWSASVPIHASSVPTFPNGIEKEYNQQHAACWCVSKSLLEHEHPAKQTEQSMLQQRSAQSTNKSSPDFSISNLQWRI